jgi:drug/metabolite transporter (DMT)-like permease
LGVAWLGEAPSPRKLAGLALILAGILALRLEERPRGPATTLRHGPEPAGEGRGPA